MPNKTIYVSEEDLPLFSRAQELSGGNLSATITSALKRYVEAEEGRREGYQEITVPVGPGPGRRVRFTGVLLGEWSRSTSRTVETYRVFRSQKGRFVVHTERSPDYVHTAGDGPADSAWRNFLNSFSSNQTWGSNSGERFLEVYDTADKLRESIPPELYELIAGTLAQPPIEDLDI
ncbi:EXLDI protein [Paractinoplanes globisporus]|jgi:EXLDI family protein|uniref:EXLDI protein n=1 Tax=Paractinoplanes globisporus TaxID=113565 RepID=A0ABW6WB00_9ACTN|nr:EXLDI protein [Actinoplanes globisporus]